MFVFRQRYVTRQSQHLKQFDRLIVHIGKDNAGSALFGDGDDPEEDRDPDAVNKLGVAEIDN